MSLVKSLPFYQRFVQDIITGKKTITIRDAKAKDYTIGQTVNAITDHDKKIFAELQIFTIESILFNELNDSHAKQENMPLLELKETIRKIYPDVDELYVIGYQLID